MRPQAVNSAVALRAVEEEPRRLLLPRLIHGEMTPRKYYSSCASNPTPSNIKCAGSAESRHNLELQVEAKKKELLHLLNQINLHGALGKTRQNKMLLRLLKQSSQESIEDFKRKANRQFIIGMYICSGVLVVGTLVRDRI
ncbi:unnamed protein product [Urochloa humidicola]